MTPEDKLAAILAVVQTDPGNRGLARVPGNNLLTATGGDFTVAVERLAAGPVVEIVTGFFIPGATPPAFETDGPPGALCLGRALRAVGGDAVIVAESAVLRAISAGCRKTGVADFTETTRPAELRVWIERAGPAADGRHYTMRGRDTSPFLTPAVNARFDTRMPNIAVGDGGNEVGMGRVPHDVIERNIPNGGRVHCRIPADFLLVAGVSNWGAYALAAGLFVLRSVSPTPDLFDPDAEREILQAMVEAGPLVDGVTGEPTATVDGLTWDEYAKPLHRIREILRT